MVKQWHCILPWQLKTTLHQWNNWKTGYAEQQNLARSAKNRDTLDKIRHDIYEELQKGAIQKSICHGCGIWPFRGSGGEVSVRVCDRIEPKITHFYILRISQSGIKSWLVLNGCHRVMTKIFALFTMLSVPMSVFSNTQKEQSNSGQHGDYFGNNETHVKWVLHRSKLNNVAE